MWFQPSKPSVATLTKELIENQGRHDFYSLRKSWSRFLMFSLFAMLAFQMGLTVLIGTGHLDFTKYPVLISLVVGENFVQIIGMCVLVVQFLFQDSHPHAS